METRIRINTDALDMNILEGIQKMFPHKTVEITVQEDYAFEEGPFDAKEGEEDATEFILNRPAYAAELLRRIKNYEENPDDLINVSPEDLAK